MLSEKQIENIFTLSGMGWSAYAIAKNTKCDIKTVLNYLKQPGDYRPPDYQPQDERDYQMPRIASPPMNHQQNYSNNQRRVPRHIRFRNHRDQEIENMVDDELARMSEYSEYNGIPPLPLPELYDLKQQLRRQFSRELDDEDARKKQTNVAQQEKSELEHLKNLLNLNTIKEKLGQQGQKIQEPDNPALVKLQLQLDAQKTETERIKEKLSVKKENSMIDTINRLELQISEISKKNNRDWLQK